MRHLRYYPREEKTTTQNNEGKNSHVECVYFETKRKQWRQSIVIANERRHEWRTNNMNIICKIIAELPVSIAGTNYFSRLIAHSNVRRCVCMRSIHAATSAILNLNNTTKITWTKWKRCFFVHTEVEYPKICSDTKCEGIGVMCSLFKGTRMRLGIVNFGATLQTTFFSKPSHIRVIFSSKRLWIVLCGSVSRLFVYNLQEEKTWCLIRNYAVVFYSAECHQ